MKIQIKFTYNAIDYQYTIDERDVDMEHYEGMWDFWLGESENELADKAFKLDDDREELTFEVTALKVFRDENDGVGIISGKDLYVNVYESEDNVQPDDVIYEDEIEILYA